MSMRNLAHIFYIIAWLAIYAGGFSITQDTCKYSGLHSLSLIIIPLDTKIYFKKKYQTDNQTK